jgi:hypothetical protein
MVEGAEGLRALMILVFLLQFCGLLREWYCLWDKAGGALEPMQGSGAATPRYPA